MWAEIFPAHQSRNEHVFVHSSNYSFSRSYWTLAWSLTFWHPPFFFSLRATLLLKCSWTRYGAVTFLFTTTGLTWILFRCCAPRLKFCARVLRDNRALTWMPLTAHYTTASLSNSGPGGDDGRLATAVYTCHHHRKRNKVTHIFCARLQAWVWPRFTCGASQHLWMSCWKISCVCGLIHAGNRHCSVHSSGAVRERLFYPPYVLWIPGDM